MLRRAIVLFVPAPESERLDEIRARWDPVMGARIGVHITLVHDVTDHQLAARLLAGAARGAEPFTVRLGAAATWGPAAWGIYLDVDDPSGGVSSLQAQLAAIESPRWSRVPYKAHVTLVHSRTTPPTVADEAWAALAGFEPGWEVTVDAVDVIELAEPAWRTVERYALAPAAVAD